MKASIEARCAVQACHTTLGHGATASRVHGCSQQSSCSPRLGKPVAAGTPRQAQLASCSVAACLVPSLLRVPQPMARATWPCFDRPAGRGSSGIPFDTHNAHVRAKLAAGRFAVKGAKPKAVMCGQATGAHASNPEAPQLRTLRQGGCHCSLGRPTDRRQRMRDSSAAAQRRGQPPPSGVPPTCCQLDGRHVRHRLIQQQQGQIKVGVALGGTVTVALMHQRPDDLQGGARQGCSRRRMGLHTTSGLAGMRVLETQPRAQAPARGEGRAGEQGRHAQGGAARAGLLQRASWADGVSACCCLQQLLSHAARATEARAHGNSQHGTSYEACMHAPTAAGREERSKGRAHLAFLEGPSVQLVASNANLRRGSLPVCL